jgi:endonuclease/exonuclease/phosphatase family metal-dependent hydrolase
MRTEKIFETIDAHDPDVLVLSEINYRWLKILNGRLFGEGGEYSAYGRSSVGRYHDKSQSGEIWDLTTLVLWKTEKYDLIDKGTFWCSSTPSRPSSKGWEDGLMANLARAINWVILEDKATGAQFLFVGVHLDARTPEVRERSTALLVEMATELAQGLPIVAMGDYNCSDNAAAYWNIHDTNLYDARYLVSAYGNMTLLGSFNKFGENTDMQVRLPIDLCFVTPETVWVDTARVDYAFVDEGKSVYASDHNAVIFELQLKQLHTVEPETETEAPTELPTEPVTDPETDPVTDPETDPGTDPGTNPETEPVTQPETALADTAEVTEVPTDVPTEAPTDLITDALTEAPTGTPTEPVTNAPGEIAPPKSGCGATLSALSLLTVLPAVLCLLRKKREE